MFRNEAELAVVVRVWLESRGFETYSEVKFEGKRIDLVGRCDQDKRVVAVETKMTFGLAVLEQALRWQTSATESWVAVPRGRRQRRFASVICSRLGLGLVEVGTNGCYVRVEPTCYRGSVYGLNRALHPEQRDVAPGTQGGHSTDFTRTCTRLASYVAEHPGTALGAAVDAVEHHYKSRHGAVRSLSKCLNRDPSPPRSRRALPRPRELGSVCIKGRGADATLWPALDFSPGRKLRS